METKFTKGNWKVVVSPNEIERYVSSENHGGICSMPMYYGDLETEDGIKESEANAKLIAAAPEMLEALQEMVNEYGAFSDVPENYKELKGYPGDENPRTMAFINALNVIKKATE